MLLLLINLACSKRFIGYTFTSPGGYFEGFAVPHTSPTDNAEQTLHQNKGGDEVTTDLTSCDFIDCVFC
jgi:hypothetical protein